MEPICLDILDGRHLKGEAHLPFHFLSNTGEGIRTPNLLILSQVPLPDWATPAKWYGWEDSNLRSRDPKSRALAN